MSVSTIACKESRTGTVALVPPVTAGAKTGYLKHMGVPSYRQFIRGNPKYFLGFISSALVVTTPTVLNGQADSMLIK